MLQALSHNSVLPWGSFRLSYIIQCLFTLIALEIILQYTGTSTHGECCSSKVSSMGYCRHLLLRWFRPSSVGYAAASMNIWHPWLAHTDIQARPYPSFLDFPTEKTIHENPPSIQVSRKAESWMLQHAGKLFHGDFHSHGDLGFILVLTRDWQNWGAGENSAEHRLREAESVAWQPMEGPSSTRS